MPKPTPWTDDSTLLCEGCGYVAEGLATDTNCPECGRPISRSLHERRPGTAFQNRPNWRTMVSTGWRTLTHPVRTLDEMRLDTGPDRRDTLAVWHALATGLALVPIPLIATLNQFEDFSTSAMIAVFLFIVASVGFLCLFAYLLAIGVRLLTATETAGLRIISRQRGFRITPSIAHTITAHGSVGWTAGAVLAWVGGGVAYVVMFDRKFGPDWLAVSLAAGLGLLAGFLFFETFAWLGLRRLKYANTRSAAEPGAGPEAG